MSEKAYDILRAVFGYESFRRGQDKIINHVIQGRDALVLMPTGGGKSLCYQIPSLARGGTGVIICPLIALMQDQVDALREVGLSAAYLNSTLSAEDAAVVRKQFLQGQLDFLYVAPERLLMDSTLRMLQQARVSLFAIDEAHCVSQWGHDFRPEYLKLSVLHEMFPDVPRVALTATADIRTREEILTRLQLDPANMFVSGFDRPNIQYRIVEKNAPRRQLLSFIQKEHAGDTGIVYCLSRKRVDTVSQWLNEHGVNALPYHAGMDTGTRAKHQDRFLKEDGLVIVATIAFGMGIDKPNVRFVAHLDMPRSIESYYQETGRAGRDGEPADAWLTYGLQDILLLRQMIDSSDADEAHKTVERQKLDAMLALCESVECRRTHLLRYFGENPEGECGNCDTCIEPPEMWDATVAVQKALSCVYRTGQRYGVGHLIDVLRGKSTDKILTQGHDDLSTFGIGADLDQREWRALFRQLTAKGILIGDEEGYGGLRLSERARPLLQGKQNVSLRKAQESTPAKSAKPARLSSSREEIRFYCAEDEILFEKLRRCRMELATLRGIPAYRVLHNVGLKEMVECRPQNLQAMQHITGMGSQKLKQYGASFLQVLQSEGADTSASYR